MTEKICDKHITKSTEEFIRFYDRLQQEPKVNPGDIIILVGGPQKVKKQSYGVVEKYKVESTHPTGLVVASRILPNGKFGRSGIVNDGWWSVQVDDQFIESVIMDAEGSYDPSLSIKNLEEKKKKVVKYNKSISKRIETEEEADEFLMSLKNGDVFWRNETFVALKDHKIEILSDVEKKIQKDYYYNDCTYYKFKAKSTWKDRVSTCERNYRAKDLIDSIVTKQEPMEVEETK